MYPQIVSMETMMEKKKVLFTYGGKKYAAEVYIESRGWDIVEISQLFIWLFSQILLPLIDIEEKIYTMEKGG